MAIPREKVGNAGKKTGFTCYERQSGTHIRAPRDFQQRGRIPRDGEKERRRSAVGLPSRSGSPQHSGERGQRRGMGRGFVMGRAGMSNETIPTGPGPSK